MTKTLKLLSVIVVVACAACGVEEAPPAAAEDRAKVETAPPAAAEAAPSAAAAKPAPAPTPAVDLSGKWECIWNVRGGQGKETWMVMQDGESIRVTLTGRDPGGRYAGSMNGTVRDRKMSLTYKYRDGTKGSMTLKHSANGKMIDGESVRAVGKTVSHYGCSRP